MFDDIYSIFYVDENNEIKSIYVFGGSDWRDRLGFNAVLSGGSSSEDMDWGELEEEEGEKKREEEEEEEEEVVSGEAVEEEEEEEEEGEKKREQELIFETSTSSKSKSSKSKSSKSTSSIEDIKLIEDVSDLFADPTNESQVRKVFKDKALYDQVHTKPIYMVYMNIHPDDSIQTIKYKFLHAVRKTSPEFNSYDELYMYSPISYVFTLNEIYQKITQKGSIELSKVGILQFLSTMYKFNQYAAKLNEITGDRQECTFEDLIELNMDQEDYIVNVPLGQDYTLNRRYPIPTNPHNWKHIASFLGNVSPISNILREYSAEMCRPENNKTLLTYGHIRHNIIFAMNTTDILNSYRDTSLMDEKTLISIYFPYLYTKSIFDTSSLQDKQKSLKQTTSLHLSDAFHNRNHIIDSFYKMYNHLRIQPTGNIREMTITISQKTHMMLPLNYLFNLIPTTETIPMSRYHEDIGYMKLYRLYSTQSASNGKRIPKLDIKYINFANLRSGRAQSLMFYIDVPTEIAEDERLLKTQTRRKKDVVEIEDTPHIYNMTTCVLQQNGTIKIKIIRISPITIQEVRNILMEYVQPLLEVVKKYVDKAGLYLNTLKENNISVIDTILYRMGGKTISNVTYNHINIHNIHYISSVHMEEKEYTIMNEPILSLLSPIFSIHKGVLNKSNKLIDIKYKRVSSYSENDDAKDFVLMALDEDKPLDYIIKQLMEIFKLDELNAKSTVQTIMRDAVVVNNDQGKNVHYVNNGYWTNLFLKDNHMISYIHDIEKLEYVPILNMYIKVTLQLMKYYDLDEDKFFDKFGIPKSAIEDIVKKDIQKDEEVDLILGEPVRIEVSDESYQSLLSLSGSQDGGARKSINNLLAERRKRHKEFFQDPYVRKCQPNTKHPLFMTDEEKQAFEVKNPDYFKQNDAFRYGKGNKKVWFSCPRYISMKDFTPVDEKDIDKDAIIKDMSNIKEGEYIYDRLKDAKGKYLHPGFIKKGDIKNADGFAFTCCFTENERQLKDRVFIKGIDEDVLKDVDFGSEEKAEQIVPRKEDRKNPLYLYDAIRSIPYMSVGRIPPHIASLFDIDYSKVVSSATSSLLKSNATTILRYGVNAVSKSFSSSFVNAICAYFTVTDTGIKVLENGKEGNHPTVEEWLRHLHDTLTFDDFNQYFGGALSHLFEDLDGSYTREYMGLDSEEKDKLHRVFYASKFYQELRKKLETYRTMKIKDIDVRRYMARILYAYYRFKKMLMDETNMIDYSHLWDIIQRRNENMFKEGVNMVIIEERGTQAHIICPRLYMTLRKPVFVPHKKTIILYKRENMYYPIFKVSNKSRGRMIERVLKNDDDMIADFIEYVKEAYRLCAEPHIINKVTNAYMIEPNINANELIQRVRESEDKTYSVGEKVRHEERTYISGVILKSDVNVFVPVEPTAGKSDVVFDEKMVLSYKETVQRLTDIADKYDVPCRPYKKVIEGGNVVGIYTVAGAFVGVEHISLVDVESDGLEKIIDVDEIKSDRDLFFSKKGINAKTKEIMNIYMEDKFYSLFRQLLRTLLNNYKYIKERRRLEEYLEEKISYIEKLNKVERELREFMGRFVEFKDRRRMRMNENDLIECYEKTSDECAKMANKCVYKEGMCKTPFPKQNLITDKTNMYYTKLADELIRYGRIFNYVFNPHMYIMFEPIKMKLGANEFVYNDLDNEYVKDIDVGTVSRWVNGNSYFTYRPQYDNTVNEVIDV